MSDPRVPGRSDRTSISLPCDRTIPPDTLDLGMREYECECGERHAVVMDVHPVSRWVPESVEAVFVEAVDTADDQDVFSTMHVMGLVLEEYPGKVAVTDVSDHDALGCAMVWVTTFDARRLHVVVVELLVELMEHAMSHADDENRQASFEEQLFDFDVEAFVDAYRTERDFEDETDRAV